MYQVTAPVAYDILKLSVLSISIRFVQGTLALIV
jgi:hypothetical protein